MSIYIMVSMLVISTDDMMTVVELSQLQALELVEKGLQDNGGLIEIFLKDRKDSLIIPILGDDDWNDAKEFIKSNLISISNFTSRDVIIQDKNMLKDYLAEYFTKALEQNYNNNLSPTARRNMQMNQTEPQATNPVVQSTPQSISKDFRFTKQ